MKKALSVFFALALCCSLTACSEGKKSEPEIQSSAATSSTVATELKEPEEHGTSAYVDYLYYKAKADSETATNEELQAALDWLKENIDSIFSSQENMELTMYNGELLERKYKDTGNAYEKIGWQAFKTVKYVYRGEESKTDDATVQNYNELKELLANVDDIA